MSNQFKAITLLLFFIFICAGVTTNISYSDNEKKPIDEKEFQKYNKRGLKHYNENKWKEAIKAFNQAIKINSPR